MDQRSSRMRIEGSKLDMRHRSHSPSFYTHHRPNQSGARQQQHGGFHNQNEAHPLHEFPDYYDNAFSQRTHHQTRSHVATSHYGGGPQRGSIPRAEPHPRGGSRGGTQPHSEPHRHGASRGGTQPHNNTRKVDFPIRGPKDRVILYPTPLLGRTPKGMLLTMENFTMVVCSTATVNPINRLTTMADTTSHTEGRLISSGFSMARSHLTSRSRVSSKIHPKEDSWSDDEQIQKRKKTQRAHKKLHSGNIFQLILDKINTLIWGLREMMMSLTQSLGFETFIFLVVCLNSVILVAQTFTEMEIRGEWYFMVLDSIFLAIYVVEALLKLIALGVEYFYDPWNNLDFFIMVMAVLDFVLLQINSLSYSFYNHSLFRILKVFKSMRALRAIRVLRRLSILTSLHEVTGTLSGSLPSITAILTLMFTCIFLFSVVLRALFRKSDPKRFQNIFTTLFTLFTLLTLDDWSIIYMDSRAQGAWYIIPILMIYIIIQYFIFLNLVIAVLVDNFQMALLKGLEKVKIEKAARVHEKLLDDSLTELTQADTEAQMSESALQTQFIDRMFGNMTERQRELHFQFLQLVASVELHQQKFRSQASVIDEIVDTAFEAGEDDYGK
ncbi:cation channel sperm-associated protein 1 [Psammomys obesus]|uniref:cation channel sperm-associated protein 1 n=1 Tax=Psammomys obesus TaxID=48139 RepID=UPI00245291A4|nr:cation channel sperm-associated protein 1 [Psammomys obesus]